MGMFDYILYQDKCSCGEELEGFQSKDGPCTLDTLNPEDVRSFYTSCTKCNKWYNYKVIVRDYEIIRQDKNKKDPEQWPIQFAE